ncbi:MAG: hypothetical protein CUN54_09515, partial [Phototrophicales bacterium]
MNTKFFVLLLTAVLSIAACQGNIRLQQDENFNYLTVTLPEREVANAVENIFASGNSQWRNVDVDLRPGQIFVRAEHVANTGAITPGSLSFRAWAQDGILQLAVNSFDFGGLSANQTGIDNFNQQLAANLARAAA